MRWLYLILAAGLLAACGGGESPQPQEPTGQPPLAACSMPQQQEAVRGYMARNYFWRDHLGEGDAAAPSMQAYFDSLLYEPLDRYSFSEATSVYDDRVVQGQRAGYGYTLVWMDAARTQLRVRSVEPLSPAGLSGLKRGQRIASIDGLTPAEIGQGLLPAVTAPGVPRMVIVHGESGGIDPVFMLSARYPLTIVPATATFTVTRDSGGAAVPVGYIAYHSFVANANDKLADAIAAMARAGVRELVLDLRYNGGGSVAVSRDLASMIGGARVRDALFTYLRFNPDNVVRNQSLLFRPGAFTLPAPALETVDRLIVLTSPNTASASELVINGLKPFMPVVLVGGTTYGKPFGSLVQHHCGTTYHAIQFTTLNALGQADYANGFAPDCAVADDLDHELGDPREARLAAALHYVKTGMCPVGPQARMAARKAAGGSEAIGETDPGGMWLD